MQVNAKITVKTLTVKNTVKTSSAVKVSTSLTVSNSGGEVYKGEYEVIPSVVEQTLATKNKYLINDVTVTEIPFSKVANDSGGNTVTIGVAPVDQNGETILLNL